MDATAFSLPTPEPEKASGSHQQLTLRIRQVRFLGPFAFGQVGALWVVVRERALLGVYFSYSSAQAACLHAFYEWIDARNGGGPMH